MFLDAARTAHKAATDEENQPDNKYDTLALESSYVAQGQANRAQELRRSIASYKQLTLVSSNNNIGLASLVTLEGNNGVQKRFFIGPAEGGIRITTERLGDVTVITLVSPLGKALIGNKIDDSVEIKAGATHTTYQIISVL